MNKKMTRQELIDDTVVGVYGMPLKRAQYNAYRELGYHNPPLPPWEEMVFSQKPWLASDEAFNAEPMPLTPEELERAKREGLFAGIERRAFLVLT